MAVITEPEITPDSAHAHKNQNLPYDMVIILHCVGRESWVLVVRLISMVTFFIVFCIFVIKSKTLTSRTTADLCPPFFLCLILVI